LDASEKLVQQHRQALGQLIEARRNAKLLEILRERRLKAHTRSIVKQSEAEAAELHLARRTRIGRCIC
jgi:DNA phosphorothioation-dependent restriction protein DptG